MYLLTSATGTNAARLRAHHASDLLVSRFCTDFLLAVGREVPTDDRLLGWWWQWAEGFRALHAVFVDDLSLGTFCNEITLCEI